MEKQIKTIIGEVMDRTEDSIQIKKIWIKFFDSFLLKEIQVNDNVEITYLDNQKNGKIYHNGKSIKVIQKLTNVNSKVSDTTINTLLITTKELYLSDLNKNNLSMENLASQVVKAYKKIIKELN